MKNISYSTLLQPYKDSILYTDDRDLPGHDALEITRDLQKYIIPAPDNAMQAAVVLMIHASNGVPSILFIQRSDHIIQDKHRGQIAFPGGKVENHESLKECAFREMEEEIGLTLSADHPTRRLSPYYVSVSNFLIHPFVAFKDQLPNLQPNPEEVAAIIDSPLTDLEQRYAIHRKDFFIRGQTWKDVPYFQVADKILWGATAIIFSELLYLLRHHS
jgi:8-oxo-dGTP pyrophosphatase MutT (NUDIX family)